MAQLLDEDPSLIDAVNDGEEASVFGGGGYSGRTALHMASFGCGKVVALLLAVKPSLVAVRDDEGYIALHLATSRRNAEIVKFLLAASPSSGLIADFDGKTALMQAALNDNLELVELLLTACPNALDLVDQYQYTALLYAASKHHSEITSLLLAAKPRNIRAADSDWNVLHYEVSCGSRYHGHAENVEKILAIDPGLVRTLTVELQTPLWLAVNNGYNELIENLFPTRGAHGRFPWVDSLRHCRATQQRLRGELVLLRRERDVPSQCVVSMLCEFHGRRLPHSPFSALSQVCRKHHSLLPQISRPETKKQAERTKAHGPLPSAILNHAGRKRPECIDGVTNKVRVVLI